MITWNCMGDSITDDIYIPRHYYNVITEKYPEITIRNYGICGTRIGGHRVCGEDHLMMCRRYREMEPADVISVWGGVNDWGQENPTPLGVMGDDTEETFYGALEILCRGLQETFPESKLFFMTPIGNDGYEGMPAYENVHGYTVEAYADAVIEVCEKHGIPVVDLYRVCGFTPHDPRDNEKYFIDGLHLSVAGQEKVSVSIEGELACQGIICKL